MKSLCKSFKSYGSNKRTGGPPPSTSRPADSHEDCLPILLESTADLDPSNLEIGLGGRLTLPVDLKRDGSRMWREPSIEFQKGSEEEAPAQGSTYLPHQEKLEDPLSWLIRQFLHEQWASGDVLLDTDMEMEELRGAHSRSDLPLVTDSPTVPQPPKQSQDYSKMSFLPPISTEAGPGQLQKQHKGYCTDGNSFGSGKVEAAKCTSRSISSGNQACSAQKQGHDCWSHRRSTSGDRAGFHNPANCGLVCWGRQGMRRRTCPWKKICQKYTKAWFGAMTLSQWMGLVFIIGSLLLQFLH